MICGVSAIAQKTNAPNLFRDEAMNLYSVNPDKYGLHQSTQGVETIQKTQKQRLNRHYLSKCFGSKLWVHAEKAIAANVAAVREWDSNGTVFGYNANLPGH